LTVEKSEDFENLLTLYENTEEDKVVITHSFGNEKKL